MARLKELFGPYTHAFEQRVAIWKFSGVRDNGEFAAWELTYYYASRKFTVSALRTDQETKYAKAMSQGRLFNEGEDATGPILEGTVTELLKARIPADQLAKAVAKSILMGG